MGMRCKKGSYKNFDFKMYGSMKYLYLSCEGLMETLRRVRDFRSQNFKPRKNRNIQSSGGWGSNKNPLWEGYTLIYIFLCVLKGSKKNTN